jgi:hypothetical protein
MTNDATIMNFDANKILESVIVRMHALTEALEYENNLLKSHKIGAVVKEQEQKLSLVDDLEKLDQLIKARPDIKKLADTKIRQRLMITQKKLHLALNENQELLVKARAVNKIIVDSMIMAMNEGKKQEMGYNSKGKFISNQSMKKYMTPVNLDNKI